MSSPVRRASSSTSRPTSRAAGWARALTAALGLAVLAAPVLAVRPAWYELDTYEDFSAGKVNGLAVTDDGRLVPAPALAELGDSGQPYILSAVRDGSGTVYFGTGHDGKVFRLDPKGGVAEVFDAEEPDIFALAAGPDGTVYIGASPGGRIYRLGRDGKATPMADLKCRYVWALAVGRDGALYAATGVEGRIYRVAGDEPAVLFDSDQTHVLSLAVGADGRLLAGTAPSGYLLRVGADGRAESLFDAPFAEIRQIVLDRYGAIYALAFGKESADGEAKAGAADAIAADVVVSVFQSDEAPKPRRSKADAAGAATAAAAGGSTGDLAAVYRLGKTGGAFALWRSAEEKAFAFALQPDGTVILGTGTRGRLLAQRPDRVRTALAESGQEQVTALLPGADGLLAFTSNQGRVYRLGTAAGDAGEWVSEVADAGAVARFGVLRTVTAPLPEGVRAEYTFRCGNTARSDATWSAWQVLAGDGASRAIGAPPARYFQVRVALRAEGRQAPGLAGVWVERLAVSYAQLNQAPRLLAVAVNPPGVVFQKQPAMVQPGEPPDYGAASTLELPPHILAGLTRMTGSIQLPRIFKAGQVSLSWTDEDPNGDLREYAVDVRPAAVAAWTRLAAELREQYLNVNPDVLADGDYVFRVTVSDAPANVPEEAGTDALVSPVVTVDTRAPQLRLLASGRAGGRLEFKFEASDERSPLHALEYSTDGGRRWEPLFPEDGLCDQTLEQAKLAVPELATEVRQLLVRAMDHAGNVSVLAVEPPAQK
jgi:outer membrane protein assembly factor BamB